MLLQVEYTGEYPKSSSLVSSSRGSENWAECVLHNGTIAQGCQREWILINMEFSIGLNGTH
jgi:hypothetical protein